MQTQPRSSRILKAGNSRARRLFRAGFGLLVMAAAIVAVIAGCAVRKPPFVDRTPPALSWWVEKEGQRGVQGFHSAAGTMKLDSGSAYVISSEARDNAALLRLSLSGIGTYRCATRDGSWAAPYDIIMPIPNLVELQPVTVGQQIRTNARIQYTLHVAATSCGRHRIPGQRVPQELFAVSGEILLRAAATDMTGGSVEGTLRIAAVSRLPRVLTTGIVDAHGHLFALR